MFILQMAFGFLVDGVRSFQNGFKAIWVDFVNLDSCQCRSLIISVGDSQKTSKDQLRIVLCI